MVLFILLVTNCNLGRFNFYFWNSLYFRKLLFPLDGCGRLGTDVVYDAIHASYLIDDFV